ncbi:MAG: ribosomal-protein-alanine N-acetyltransferase [Methylophagaceae bacterium]|jgi:ribosomal-protein-alanine N-acetyltransferase
MQDKITLREMIKTDLVDVADIEKQSTPFPWSLKHFEDCFKVGYPAWVMCDGEERIVSFVVIQKVIDELHILNICVHRQHQRQGLGKAMLNHIIQYAKQIGSALILLEVRRSNNKAQSLYCQTGFNEMSVRQGYYPAEHGREDAILMGLDLDLQSLFSAIS